MPWFNTNLETYPCSQHLPAGTSRLYGHASLCSRWSLNTLTNTPQSSIKIKLKGESVTIISTYNLCFWTQWRPQYCNGDGEHCFRGSILVVFSLHKPRRSCSYLGCTLSVSTSWTTSGCSGASLKICWVLQNISRSQLFLQGIWVTRLTRLPGKFCFCMECLLAWMAAAPAGCLLPNQALPTPRQDMS